MVKIMTFKDEKILSRLLEEVLLGKNIFWITTTTVEEQEGCVKQCLGQGL